MYVRETSGHMPIKRHNMRLTAKKVKNKLPKILCVNKNLGKVSSITDWHIGSVQEFC